MGVRGALEFFSLLFFSIRLHGAVDGSSISYTSRPPRKRKQAKGDGEVGFGNMGHRCRGYIEASTGETWG